MIYRALIIASCLLLLIAPPAHAQDVPVSPPAGEVVFDWRTGELLYGRNDEAHFSIASITKLMTVLVFLDHNPGLKKRYVYTKQDNTIPAKIPLRYGEAVSVQDLFYASLVGSRNNAARALAHSTGMTEKKFVKKMNQKAKKLGMRDTVFVETTGLDKKNRSTPADVAILARAAFEKSNIKRALSRKGHWVQVLNYSKRRLYVKNTNPFIAKADHLVGIGKTGYIDESGYNFVARSTGTGGDFIALVFGAQNRDKGFHLARSLIQSRMSGVSASASNP